MGTVLHRGFSAHPCLPSGWISSQMSVNYGMGHDGAHLLRLDWLLRELPTVGDRGNNDPDSGSPNKIKREQWPPCGIREFEGIKDQGAGR
jgi:hypothetical protein